MVCPVQTHQLTPFFVLPVYFLGQSANVVGYGHLGDGNLHLNISAPRYDDTVVFFFIDIFELFLFWLLCDS